LKDRQRKGAILRDNWRERFEEFAKRLAGENVYVTIDLDCLCVEQAVTNWESGASRWPILSGRSESFANLLRSLVATFAARIRLRNMRVGSNVSLLSSTGRSSRHQTWKKRARLIWRLWKNSGRY
jgi:hypothetical protein